MKVSATSILEPHAAEKSNVALQSVQILAGRKDCLAWRRSADILVGPNRAPTTKPTRMSALLCLRLRRVAVYADLIKVRLTSLVMLTALVGFYIGAVGPMDYGLMFHTLLGTGLVAGAAAALNQLLERDYDALMKRTEDRPLPSGRLQPETVLICGVCAGAGLMYLALAVNLLTSVVGAITLGSYLFVYTPLKRITSLNTVVGAIPGALPALMGWTAARGEVTVEGWALFAIVAFWQLPHFMAIAWIYREDYARAGFAMLPVLDPDGQRTGHHAQSWLFAAGQFVSFVFKLAGPIYWRAPWCWAWRLSALPSGLRGA